MELINSTGSIFDSGCDVIVNLVNVRDEGWGGCIGDLGGVIFEDVARRFPVAYSDMLRSVCYNDATRKLYGETEDGCAFDPVISVNFGERPPTYIAHIPVIFNGELCVNAEETESMIAKSMEQVGRLNIPPKGEWSVESIGVPSFAYVRSDDGMEESIREMFERVASRVMDDTEVSIMFFDMEDSQNKAPVALN